MQQKNPGTKGYPEFDQLSLPAIEQDILKFWAENGIFEKSVTSRSNDKRFVFYEGPPSANGKPGIHHVMSRTIKDLFCRFKTLQGYRVERKAGWDTHGLPVELGVEKQLGITKADIGTKITVAEYNRLCREDVMKFTGVWNDLTTKMGYWVDLEHPYITYENNYIETLWALLKTLYDKGLLYEGYTIQPYSPAAGTGLSSHELNQPGCYRNVKDVTAIAMFKVVKDEKSKFLFESEGEDVRFLAWTTTPWTLPSNTALAVGGGINYVKIKTHNPFSSERQSIVLAVDLLNPVLFRLKGSWLLSDFLEIVEIEYRFKNAKYIPDGILRTADGDYIIEEKNSQVDENVVSRLQTILPVEGINKAIIIAPTFSRRDFADNILCVTQLEVIQGKTGIPEIDRFSPLKISNFFTGKSLEGIRYEQLLPYTRPADGDAFRVVVGDFVTTSDGTGIVHIAPSFGSDDFRVAKQNGIGSLTL
ncbi:MAG TPA: class I tRNA ligase family protein, partial [Chitinophagales bacterium]|nr:class I tRNA ligase family protein [Chitinophagales bacterium]